MRFSEFVFEHSERLAGPLAALVALTDVALDQLPEAERSELLHLVRENAVQASVLVGELRARSRCRAPEPDVDLRGVDAGPTAA